MRLLAGLDIDFVQGFDVFGDERDGNHQKILFSRAGQLSIVSVSDGSSHFRRPTRL